MASETGIEDENGLLTTMRKRKPQNKGSERLVDDTEPEENEDRRNAVLLNKSAGFPETFRRAMRRVPAIFALRAVLPRGSWWDLQQLAGRKAARGKWANGSSNEDNSSGGDNKGSENGSAEGDSAPGELWDAIRKLWRFCAPNRTMLVLAALCLALAALSEVAMPHYLAAAIFAASNGLTDEFNSNVRLLIAMTLACGLFSGLRAALFTIFNVQMMRRMRLTLYETLIRQDIAFFDGQSVGDLTSRLGSDCQAAGYTMGSDLNIVLRHSLLGIGTFVFLVRLSWQMALMAAALCGVMWYLLVVYGNFSRLSSMVLQDNEAAANEVAEETVSLVRVVRTFGTESEEVKRYDEPLKRLVEVGLRRSVANGLWTCADNVVYNSSMVGVVIMAGGALMTGRISAEQVTQFVMYADWMAYNMWCAGDHWATLMDSIGACHRVFQLLDLPNPEQLNKGHGRVLLSLSGKLEFRNLSFRYPTRPEALVLEDINLTIQPGELVALVGHNGSGKSTLLRLLQRLYEPSEGQVLIDDVPLPEIDIAWLRSHIGVVSQEPLLFSRDVASNIAYGSSKELSREDIIRAATQANAHQFISELPEGYDTVVDNARLSGGQKQRIAIARALVRDPTLLFLDEATSALDAESEHYVQVALNQVIHDDSHASGGRRRTRVVIAHRLPTIRSADRIVVVSHGKIIEVGTHEELMERKGAYMELHSRRDEALASH